MAKRDLVDAIVKPVPEELKAAIKAEAAKKGMGVSTVAVAILAEEFGHDYEPHKLTKVVPQSKPNPTQLYLTMPRSLRKKIRGRAWRSDVHPSEVMRDVLCDHYGITAQAAAA